MIKIYCTLGNEINRFERILSELLRLMEVIKGSRVSIQSGNSFDLFEGVFANSPRLISHKAFFSGAEHSCLLSEASVILTHCGAGTLEQALQCHNSLVVALPRLERFGEHQNDHQLELYNEFKLRRLILGVSDIGGEFCQVHQTKKPEYTASDDLASLVVGSLMGKVSRFG